MDLSLGLEGQHVVVTGGSGFIGSATILAFLSAGANVSSLDIKPPPNLLSDIVQYSSNHTEKKPESKAFGRFRHYTCDIASERQVNDTFEEVGNSDMGFVKICVALASLDWSVLEHHDSLVDMSVEQWRRTHQVNVEGTFLTARAFLRGLQKAKQEMTPPLPSDVSLIIIGSESGRFGVRGNADYAAGKSAVQVGLLRSLTDDIARIWPGGRVNAIAPGAVDTPQFRKECQEDATQYWQQVEACVASRKPIPTEAVAKSIVFLASSAWSGSVNGQVLNVDSGKSGKVIWTKEECVSGLDDSKET